MSNREIEFILRMRDYATQTWNAVKGKISSGSKSLAQSFSRNWVSIGAVATGAIYLIGNAMEKMERLAKKTGKAIEGSTGGSMASASNQLQELSTTIETIKTIADEALIRGGLFALGVGKSVATFFATLFGIIATPMALIEKGLNALGISSSKYFQNLVLNSAEIAFKLSKDATDAFEAAFASSKNLGLGIETLRSRVERLKKELDAMAPTMSGYVEKYREWKHAADELAQAEKHAAQMAMQGHKLRSAAVLMQTKTIKDLVKEGAAYKAQLDFMAQNGAITLGEIQKLYVDIGASSQMSVEVFDQYWTYGLNHIRSLSASVANDFYEFFRGNVQGVNELFKNFVANTISQFARMISEIIAQAMFAQMISLIWDSAGGFGNVFKIISGIDIKGSRSSTGTGQGRLPAAPDISNRMAGQGSTVVVQFLSPVPHGQWVVDSVKQAVRETGMSIDKLVVNNRSTVLLAGS